MTRYYVAALVAAIVAANLATFLGGQRPVGFGLVAPVGTLFVGLVFALRDTIHDRGGYRAVLVAIAAGTAVSFLAGWVAGSPIPTVSAVQIAAASGAAFALSELADWSVYSPIRPNHPVAAMLLSNTVGAAVDTWLFLTWSGFGVTAPAFWGQVLVKVAVVSPLAVWLLRPRDVPHAALPR